MNSRTFTATAQSKREEYPYTIRTVGSPFSQIWHQFKIGSFLQAHKDRLVRAWEAVLEGYDTW